MVDVSSAYQAKPAKQSILTIQALRGVAALLVVGHHATILASERLSSGRAAWPNGACGVDIFFVISGFVMALSSRSLKLKSKPARTFLVRRIERVVPLYWIITSLKILVILAAPSLARNALGSAWNIVASYLFVPSYNDAHLVQPVVIVGWTLNYEMLFYVIFAFALWLKRPPLYVVSGALILISAGSLLIHPGGPAVLTFCDPVLLEFLYGMLLFEGYKRGIRMPMQVAWGAVSVGLAVMLLFSPGNLLPRFIIWGLPALAVVAGAISLEERVCRLIPRWTLEVGDSSYSIYLSHLFVLPVVAILLRRVHIVGVGSIAPAIVLSVLIAIAAGEATYRFLELPIMQFFRERRVPLAGDAAAL